MWGCAPARRGGPELRSAPRAQLDHGVVGQAEELHHAAGIAAHRREQALAPGQPAGAGGGHDGLAAQVVAAGAIGRRRRRPSQRLRHVGRLHEAEAQRHAPEVVAERLQAARARPRRRPPAPRRTAPSGSRCARAAPGCALRLCSSASGTVARIRPPRRRRCAASRQRCPAERLRRRAPQRGRRADRRQRQRMRPRQVLITVNSSQRRARAGTSRRRKLHRAGRHQQGVERDEEQRRPDRQGAGSRPGVAHDHVGQQRW